MFNKTEKKNNVGDVKLNTPITTIIGPEITIEGDLSGKQTIKIDGSIKGNVHIENGIILGEKGSVTGNIKSNTVIIYGEIHGNIDCKELTLKNTGIINGDILTNTIEIENGGRYNGQLRMELPTTSNPLKTNKKLEKEMA